MPSPTASAKLLEPILQLAQLYPQNRESLKGSLTNSDIQDDVTSGLKNEASLQEQLLACAGLSIEDFTKPGARFPTKNYANVLNKLIQISRTPHITLRLAEATQPRMLGSLGFLMSTAETLEKAYGVLEEYLSLLFETANLQLEPCDKGVWLTLKIEENDACVVEYFLACLLNWPRGLTGRQIPVHSVELALPEPDNLQAYQQFFAAEVRFNAEHHRLLLDSRYLSLTCVDANAEMHQLHKEFADTLLSKTSQQKALIAQLRTLIRQQLLGQGESIRREQVADDLGLSLRTLQRKLGALGTNFQAVYDQTRQELCLQLIQKGQLSFGEIAFQLGFSNQSAFQKAFKRWMGLAPSLYRQQLQPVQIDTLESKHQENSGQWLQQPDLNLAESIKEKMVKLNQFGQDLLRLASVFGSEFNLKQLADVSQNPIARLLIYLWPAEQAGLILPNSDQPEQVSFRFANDDICQNIYQQLNNADKENHHYQIGLLLWQKLPYEYDLTALEQSLYHLNLGKNYQRASDQHAKGLSESKVSNSSNPDIYQLNIKAALLAQKKQHYKQAQHYLSQAQQYLNQTHYLGQKQCSLSQGQCGPNQTQKHSSKKRTLLIKQAELYLQTEEIDSADTCVKQLIQEPLNHSHKIQCALIQASISQYRGEHQQALKHLLLIQGQNQHQEKNRKTSKQAEFPSSDTSKQLSFLLNQLTQISHQLICGQLNPSPEFLGEDIHLQLQLLEQISLLARQQAQPLLAACAISQMTELSLNRPASPLTAFAFTSYAWVASWFCADYSLAKRFTELGQQQIQQFNNDLKLTEQSVKESQSEKTARVTTETDNTEKPGPWFYDSSSSPISASLLHASQVQHWFNPLDQVLKQLEQLDHNAGQQGQGLLQSESRLLYHQLALLSTPTKETKKPQESPPLAQQLSLCQQHYQQMLPQQPYQAERLKQSSLNLLKQLIGEQTPIAISTKPHYQNAWQAISTLLAALLLDQQPLWSELYTWEALLENELAGYYGISEALFCTAMMRLIQSQQEQQLSQRRQRIIDQTESRFEIWAQHCPENFMGQLCLLRAEKARLSIRETSHHQESPSHFFEQAITHTKQKNFSYHNALAYERYSLYLVSTEQKHLASFCLDKAIALYQHWGAQAKVKQLVQQQALLAK